MTFRVYIGNWNRYITKDRYFTYIKFLSKEYWLYQIIIMMLKQRSPLNKYLRLGIHTCFQVLQFDLLRCPELVLISPLTKKYTSSQNSSPFWQYQLLREHAFNALILKSKGIPTLPFLSHPFKSIYNHLRNDVGRLRSFILGLSKLNMHFEISQIRKMD